MKTTTYTLAGILLSALIVGCSAEPESAKTAAPCLQEQASPVTHTVAFDRHWMDANQLAHNYITELHQDKRDLEARVKELEAEVATLRGN